MQIQNERPLRAHLVQDIQKNTNSFIILVTFRTIAHNLRFWWSSQGQGWIPVFYCVWGPTIPLIPGQEYVWRFNAFIHLCFNTSRVLFFILVYVSIHLKKIGNTTGLLALCELVGEVAQLLHFLVLFLTNKFKFICMLLKGNSLFSFINIWRKYQYFMLWKNIELFFFCPEKIMRIILWSFVDQEVFNCR